MTENKTIFAQNLVRLMEQRNVNATEVCQALKIKHNTFSSWVNAKTFPRIDKIELLSNYFGVPMSALVEENHVVEDLTPRELQFLQAYRHADFVTKSAIDRLIAYYISINEDNNLKEFWESIKENDNKNPEMITKNPDQ